MNKKTNKLAMAILAFSMTQAVNASESSFQHEADHESTYWGIGIGSVLGAVIAGPPGAALGATLGGSLGWGKDQNDALDESLSALEQREVALQQNHQLLEHNRKTLTQSQHEIQSLRKTQAMQSSRLADLEKTASENDDSAFLKNLSAHYAQDIYFGSGQSQAPDYAQARLSNLVALLKSHPDLQVTLKGYTDTFGSAKLNAALAQARVDSIREFLKTQDIDETRIIGLAIGEVKPTTPEFQDADAEPLADLDELGMAVSAEKKPKPKDHVLDRRVSIELSIANENNTDKQTLASLDQSNTESSSSEPTTANN